MYEGSSFPTSLPILGIACIFDYSHSGGMKQYPTEELIYTSHCLWGHTELDTTDVT